MVSRWSRGTGANPPYYEKTHMDPTVLECFDVYLAEAL